MFHKINVKFKQSTECRHGRKTWQLALKNGKGKSDHRFKL